MYRQFDDVFNNFSILGSDDAWLQAHVVNDRSVIKQNMDMESYTLSSTADDEGKFQPICKYSKFLLFFSELFQFRILFQFKKRLLCMLKSLEDR